MEHQEDKQSQLCILAWHNFYNIHQLFRADMYDPHYYTVVVCDYSFVLFSCHDFHLEICDSIIIFVISFPRPVYCFPVFI